MASQLALIDADGNRVGVFLSELARRGQGRRVDVVDALNTATAGCVARAAVACYADQPALRRDGVLRLPVLAHYIGGDDVSVSVPAPFAWRFVTELCRQFQSLLGPALKLPELREVPTLSAGMVFHHRSQPISDVVRLADRELRRAKDAVCGREAAVSFLDLTADGGEAAGDRVWTVAELGSADSDLVEVAGVPAAQRQQLLTLLRQCADPTFPADTVGETPPQALTRRVAVMDIPVLRRITAALDRDAPDLSTAAARARLRRYLDIARWWTSAVSEPENGLVTK